MIIMYFIKTIILFINIYTQAKYYKYVLLIFIININDNCNFHYFPQEQGLWLQHKDDHGRSTAPHQGTVPHLARALFSSYPGPKVCVRHEPQGHSQRQSRQRRQNIGCKLLLVYIIYCILCLYYWISPGTQNLNRLG